ncbi:hypothetical protein AMAG_17024 [Allomyces macrogynus ATCC 38327]|uniref:Uncharacterized protein n=1 Tax=Allomyces macrogynus (strain ATCC 38327) TaxID=578462 RepID=A0A0L0TCW8_ALLM3|nr:hypothetical protein AMAG_17024 [Allomyces macrogynus ATCC 38327]|eukprot:KNE72582.1 hypothetical protein AMAG_17024 [Allomyces macrogynus ATCC 38327]
MGHMNTSTLIPFVAHLVGGSASRLTRLHSWRDRLTEAVAHLGAPQRVKIDVAQCLVHFWMPRAPGMVQAFAPAMAQDAIAPHDHPPPRALAVIFHAPRRIGDLLDVVRCNHQLPTAVLDCVGLPRIREYDELRHVYFSLHVSFSLSINHQDWCSLKRQRRYAYVSVAAEHAEHLHQLDKAWVAGKRIRVFRLHDAKSLFMFPARLMNALHAMAQRVLNDDEVDARALVSNSPQAINAESCGRGRPMYRIGPEQDASASTSRRSRSPRGSRSRFHSRERSGDGLSRPILSPPPVPTPALFVDPPPGVDPTALIPFDAHLVGGTVQDLTRLAMWRGQFMQTFTSLKCHPEHVEIDDVHNRVRFWMPRRPGMVHEVLRESGVTVAGVRVEFSPADARDVIPEHDHPPPRAVLVLFHVPYHVRVLLSALRSLRLRTDLLDCFVLPPMPAFPMLPYGFLTVHDAFADLAAGLDKMWIEGKRMRAFRIRDPRAVFANRGRLMEEVQAMARTVVADESAGQHNVPPTRE